MSRPSAKLGETLQTTDWVLPVNVRTSECYQKYDQCDAYAFSLCAELDDLLRARQILGWAKKKKSIVRLDLTPNMGDVLKTPSPVGDSHHDWWPSEGNASPAAEVVHEQLVA